MTNCTVRKRFLLSDGVTEKKLHLFMVTQSLQTYQGQDVLLFQLSVFLVSIHFLSNLYQEQKSKNEETFMPYNCIKASDKQNFWGDLFSFHIYLKAHAIDVLKMTCGMVI